MGKIDQFTQQVTGVGGDTVGPRTAEIRIIDMLRQWRNNRVAATKLISAVKNEDTRDALITLAQGNLTPNGMDALIGLGRVAWNKSFELARPVLWGRRHTSALDTIIKRTLAGAQVGQEIPTNEYLAENYLRDYLPELSEQMRGSMFLVAWLGDDSLDWEPENLADGLVGDYRIEALITHLPEHTMDTLTNQYLGEPYFVIPAEQLSKLIWLLVHRFLRWHDNHYAPVWGRVNRALYDAATVTSKE